MANRIGRNRKSPSNEEAFILAYLKVNCKDKKDDNMDVAAVITKSGERGHGLLPQEINRSHDNKYHRIKEFIPDKVLKKVF